MCFVLGEWNDERVVIMGRTARIGKIFYRRYRTETGLRRTGYAGVGAREWRSGDVGVGGGVDQPGNGAVDGVDALAGVEVGVACAS